MQDWQRHIYGCWLPTITGGTHSEGFQLKSKSTFLLVIAFPPSHCVCTARVHMFARAWTFAKLVLNLTTLKFHTLVWLLDWLRILTLLIRFVIISTDLYGFVKAQRINPALSSLSVCRWGHRVLFLLWIPEYFVLLQRLDWAPNSINIHDSCIAHKHTHARGDGVSGTNLTLSLTAEWVLWWTEAI